MAEYDIQEEQPGVDGEGDGELFDENYNQYGASEEQGGELMEIDDIPVSQEDAWAVIS
jgi:hypothetical protein